MDKLRRFNNEETDKVNIYESTIIRMSNDSDHNIVFVVDWLEGDNIKIVFKDVSDVIYDLKRNSAYEKEQIGKLEIRGFSYERKDGLYIVQFNFDTELLGVIRITCKSFAFFVPSEPITIGGNDKMIL